MFLPSWTSLPPPSPSHPSRLLQSPGQTPGLTWIFWNLVMVLFSAMWLDAWTPKRPVACCLEKKWKCYSFSHVWVFATPWTVARQAPLSMEFSRLNTGVGCHAFLQGIFPIQESNPALLHCRQILYHLSHQGNPWILEWVAYPFSRGSSWPRNQTRVSCITGRFFIVWATREALNLP